MLDEALDYCINRNKKDKKFTYEFIIVDDGSKDNTSNLVLNEYCKKYKEIRLCKLSKNRGKGGAVRMGMLRSRGNILLMVDADGATKFDNFELLENKLIEINKGKDMSEWNGMICGSRSHLQEQAVAEVLI